MPKLNTNGLVFTAEAPPEPAGPALRWGVSERARMLLSGIGDPEASALASEFALEGLAPGPDASPRFRVGMRVEYALPDGSRRVGSVAELHPEGVVVASGAAVDPALTLVPFEHVRMRDAGLDRGAIRGALRDTRPPVSEVRKAALGGTDLEVVLQHEGWGPPSEEDVRAFVAYAYPGYRVLDARGAPLHNQRTVVLAEERALDRTKRPGDRPEERGLSQEFADDLAPVLAAYAEEAHARLAMLARANPHIDIIPAPEVATDAAGIRLAFRIARGRRPLTFKNAAADGARVEADTVLSREALRLEGEVISDENGAAIYLAGREVLPRAVIAVAPDCAKCERLIEELKAEGEVESPWAVAWSVHNEHHAARHAPREDLNAPGEPSHFDDPIPHAVKAGPEAEDAEAREWIGGPGVQVANVARAALAGTGATERDIRRVASFLALAQYEVPGDPTASVTDSLLYSRLQSAEGANAVDKLVADFIARNPEALGEKVYRNVLELALADARRGQPKRYWNLVKTYATEQFARERRRDREQTTTAPKPEGYIGPEELQGYDVFGGLLQRALIQDPPVGERLSLPDARGAFKYKGNDGKVYTARPRGEKPPAQPPAAQPEQPAAQPEPPESGKRLPSFPDRPPRARAAFREAPSGTALEPTPGSYGSPPAESYAGRRQPATGNLRFRLENLRARGGYLVGDVHWDPDTVPGMSAKNIENAVRSFVEMKASHKVPVDLGHIAGVRVTRLDLDGGAAEVMFSSTTVGRFPPEFIGVTEGVAYRGTF